MHTLVTSIDHNKIDNSKNSCLPEKKSWFSLFLSFFNKEKRSMKRGLKQAEMIHAGKIKGKSFDSFLNEI